MPYSVIKDTCIHKARAGFNKTKDDICLSKLKCVVIKVKDSGPDVSTGIAEEQSRGSKSLGSSCLGNEKKVKKFRERIRKLHCPLTDFQAE